MSKMDFIGILQHYPELWDEFERLLDELSADTATSEHTAKSL